MNLNWIDGAKWAAVAAIIGTILGVLLSDGHAESAAYWGDIAQKVFVALGGAAGAFVLALRKKRS